VVMVVGVCEAAAYNQLVCARHDRAAMCVKLLLTPTPADPNSIQHSKQGSNAHEALAQCKHFGCLCRTDCGYGGRWL